ncbi:CaiB/BaiF CoA transferase family protein [Roseateles koreensis]|uniref:CaiB/BaiF CoA-transferase family protein n=1 Tax=Roseateles koreensis TaxID=2987526 RepID=A0ABT5KTU5_9BURK|nr:CaiB/BaiF CoA-transferase family protein [Roseateles koreensis]
MKPPLHGVRIVEFEGLGPGPLAGCMLADMGAEVTVITRPQKGAVLMQLGGNTANPLLRGKTVLALDLKQDAGRTEALRLVAAADALIEGNRPGVMERLGLGPADAAALNPRLVYGRMTGWGQSGPWAHTAGHDLNYVALSGLLSLSARRGERPMVPPTVLGDASGALGLAFGIACALFEARSSGQGRVVDGAIIDILAMLGGIAQLVRAGGQLDSPAPSPFHDSPFYDVYACADGSHITIGALEPQFYALLLNKLGLTDVDPAQQYDTHTWPALKARFSDLFASQPRAHWESLLGGTDVCFAPVLSLGEAALHPHNAAREIYRVDASGMMQAHAAPRFLPLGDPQDER